MAVAKKDCTCHHCKAEIKAGDKMEWYAKSITSAHDNLGKGFTRYLPVCADEKACSNRRVHAFLAKRVEQQAKEDEKSIALLRSMGTISEADIQKVIDFQAVKRQEMLNPDNFGKQK